MHLIDVSSIIFYFSNEHNYLISLELRIVMFQWFKNWVEPPVGITITVELEQKKCHVASRNESMHVSDLTIIWLVVLTVYNNHLEKDESQLGFGWLFPIWWKNNPNVPNHQPAIKWGWNLVGVTSWDVDQEKMRASMASRSSSFLIQRHMRIHLQVEVEVYCSWMILGGSGCTSCQWRQEWVLDVSLPRIGWTQPIYTSHQLVPHPHSLTHTRINPKVWRPGKNVHSEGPGS